MRLTIENKSLQKIVLNASLGSVAPVKTRTLDVTIAQLEAVRTQLVTLQAAGVITFSTEASGSSDDDAAEGATVSLAQGGGGGGVPTSRQIISGAGLTGGGDLTANRTLAVGAHADGSIVVGADTVQVGVLAADAQHGSRGGGTLHADVVAGGASGFMSGADKTKLNGIEASADVTDATNVAAAGAIMSPAGTADGDIVVRSGGVWARLPAGGDGEALQIVGGAPTYAALPASGASFQGIRINAVGSFLERAANSGLIGTSSPGFETVAAVVVDQVFASGLGARILFNNGGAFSGAGYFGVIDDARPSYSISNAAGTRFGVFVGGWADQKTSKLLIMLTVGFTGTERFCTLNGVDFSRVALADFGPNTVDPWRMGAANDGSSSARGLTFIGLAHKQNGALTQAQRLSVFETLLRTGALPDSVFTSRFAFDSLPIGALAAATVIEDVIGSEDLTVVGSDLEVVQTMPAGPAITQTPIPGFIVATTGATMTGRLVLPTVTGAAVSVTDAEYVFSTTSGTAATVNLGSPSVGKRVVVKDNDGNAATNNITVTPGSGTIDGQPTLVISTNWGSAEFVGNGTNWRVISTT